MSAGPTSCFPFEAALRVVSAAHELRLDMPEDDLSVHDAWFVMAGDSWKAQQRREHTMALVISLRQAHDLCSATVFWPTPTEYGRHCKRQTDLGT